MTWLRYLRQPGPSVENRLERGKHKRQKDFWLSSSCNGLAGHQVWVAHQGKRLAKVYPWRRFRTKGQDVCTLAVSSSALSFLSLSFSQEGSSSQVKMERERADTARTQGTRRKEVLCSELKTFFSLFLFNFWSNELLHLLKFNSWGNSGFGKIEAC